ncbi:Per1-like protein [Basidiobolus meristosporus CBS 931.73]|uniref:Post-GPI attachment to proteins factor 3 n=1 Tax=Basidiobolus meristosporus CBS 931.73 TaxID=1314790 RepID=A0A1Y1Y4X4_9FUNG|nr:Per1-like protein [Basidiobolus meristosporus CBS 931.73]|eukprot:ORX93038.1 Per1-like protein [Basidiobolus meristosporus CBS 931.73]
MIKCSGKPLVAVLLLVCFVTYTYGSYGDRQPVFNDCVSNCERSVCASNPVLPLSLRLTLWSCVDNCKYDCMRQITEKATETGEPIVQYYGKWPFLRLFGMQEPASVLFSVLNGWGHWYHWKVIKTRIPNTYFLKPFYYGYAIVGMNAWLWSSVFHTRDTPLTEKLDYFSAALTILYGLFVAVLRASHTTNRKKQVFIGILHLIPFVLHVSYLSFYKFDYGYNMKASVGIGMLHNVAWTITAIRSTGHPYRWRPIASAIILTMAMSLELFDFPPIFEALDAHSLWHAATVPILFYWYTYLIEDARWDSTKMRPKKN